MSITTRTAPDGAVDIVAGRDRAPAEGADAVLERCGQLARTMSSGMAAARALRSTPVDWSSLRDRIVASERGVVLAAGDRGALLAGHFAAGSSTTVHSHGFAGAALVVEGASLYERFQPTGPTTAARESLHDLRDGDVAWWSEPPDDLHRQTGGPDGSIELVLAWGRAYHRRDFDDVTETSPLADAVIVALRAGDSAGLAEWYAPDVLVDANVPQWRFQARGRDAALDLWSDGFRGANRRLTHLRVTATARGLLAETEVRDEDHGRPRQWREVHQFRWDGEHIVEQVVWCSGLWDEDTIARQFVEADMERL